MSTFHFKKFSVQQSNSALKVGTDAMVLGAMVEVQNKKLGLDIGTGTGVLALMQVQKSFDLNVVAVELDKPSIEDAKYNFEKSCFSKQLKLEELDILEFFTSQKFDVIFSNPPYYQNTLKGEKDNVNRAKHVQDLTPENLLLKVSELLLDNGDFWVIWPFLSYVEFIDLAELSGLYVTKKVIVNGKPSEPVRVVMCFQKNRSVLPVELDFTIRDSNGNYTEEYKMLTLEFHNRVL